MTYSRAAAAEPEIAKGAWSDIFRNGLGLYSALVIGGIAMHATQMLVIAIIMPTIVADIGGADYYTWARSRVSSLEDRSWTENWPKRCCDAAEILGA